MASDRQILRLERATYDRSAAEYAAAVAPFTLFYGRALLDRLALAPGQRVLEVACGSGLLALEAARRVAPGGAVTGVDLSPGMLAQAHAAAAAAPAPGAPLVFREGNAELLPVSDGAFDRAACVFGLMFVPDRGRALREIRRALAPGGRAGAVVWADPREVPALALSSTAFARNATALPLRLLFRSPLGPPLLRRLLLTSVPGRGPSPMSLSRPGLAEALFAAAGFSDVRTERIVQPLRFPSAGAFWEDFLMMSPLRAQLAKMPEALVAAVREGVIDGLAAHRTSDGAVAMDMTAIAITASRS